MLNIDNSKLDASPSRVIKFVTVIKNKNTGSFACQRKFRFK